MVNILIAFYDGGRSSFLSRKRSLHFVIYTDQIFCVLSRARGREQFRPLQKDHLPAARPSILTTLPTLVFSPLPFVMAHTGFALQFKFFLLFRSQHVQDT
jgi:hypothetical protein